MDRSGDGWLVSLIWHMLYDADLTLWILRCDIKMTHLEFVYF
jgi:hypothetical protein